MDENKVVPICKNKEPEIDSLEFISNKKDTVCRDKISEAFESEEGQNAIRNKVTLMHCTSEYPAPIEDLNLRAIRTLNQEFETSVGYSDHSTKVFIP